MAVGGVRLIPLNLPPRHPTRVLFDRAVLDLGPDRIGRYWINRKIRGQSGPPSTVATADLIARFVRSVPNVVGYVDGPVPPGLRAVRVDGRTPDDPEYALRISP